MWPILIYIVQDKQPPPGGQLEAPQLLGGTWPLNIGSCVSRSLVAAIVRGLRTVLVAKSGAVALPPWQLRFNLKFK